MSQFDFPRINFAGYTTIDPGTANNSYHLPLLIYDPVQCKAITPPRLYLMEKYWSEGLTLEALAALIPEGAHVEEDEEGKPFVAIHPIGNKTAFLDWAETPLGQFDLDKAFHPLYTKLIAPKPKLPLTGECPAYWNYHGRMTFTFDEVTVRGITVFDQALGKVVPVSETHPMYAFLGATIGFADQFGTNTGVMIDVSPSMSLYSQVFVDQLVIAQGDQTLLSGHPCKASLRFMNAFRIINQLSICGASGTFYCAIHEQDLKGIAPLYETIRSQADPKRNMQGLLIRYNMYEVIEDREPDYQKLGRVGNPARSSVVGTIAPWYEGEMRSFTIGRQLNAVAPYHSFRKLAPVLCKVNPELQLVSLDLAGNVPEVNLDVTNPMVDPKHFPQKYETYDLGALHLKVRLPDKTTRLLGSFTIDQEHYPADVFQMTGGMIDLSYADLPEVDEALLDSGDLLLEGISRPDEAAEGQSAVLLQEAQYLITTDEGGLYAEQGDDPADGYLSYTHHREPCRIRIFSKGKPVTTPVKMQVLEYRETATGQFYSFPQLVDQNRFHDQQALHFPLDKPVNAIYLFKPQVGVPNFENINIEVARTGYFVALRVLPKPDYGQYLDPNHPAYPTPVTFDLLYKEIFEVYDLIYPISAVISPFTEAAFERAKPILIRLMAAENWHSPTYMPSTREMSSYQRALFMKWAEGMSTGL